MSETKWTPRPWDYIGDHIVGVSGRCECPVKQSFGEWFAYPEFAHESHDVVTPIIEDDLPEGVTMQEHMANCHLIAAAPDLYDALQEAMRWIGSLTDWEGAGDPDVDRWRAVIKKAKGEL
jgi:hypothetical protein